MYTNFKILYIEIELIYIVIFNLYYKSSKFIILLIYCINNIYKILIDESNGIDINNKK